ncbi:2TM domain-containing protein [Aurantibacter sp.]|uniref:2TM domain-containing protein n=1 Tax=Aurantibacter sp. TaxID=2807103 RepID=UPI003264EB05
MDHLAKLKRAELRVKQIKKFYKHLRVFVIVNVLLLIVKFRAHDFFAGQGMSDEGFLTWLDWNIIGTPVIWSLVLGVHAFHVFVMKSQSIKAYTPKFFKDWEERQIEKFMNEEENIQD